METLFHDMSRPTGCCWPTLDLNIQILFFIFIFVLQVPDEAVNKCIACGTDFGAFVRRVSVEFMFFNFVTLLL